MDVFFHKKNMTLFKVSEVFFFLSHFKIVIIHMSNKLQVTGYTKSVFWYYCMI
jgi:hypothetical protein